jgi:hypothetical protein
MTTNSSLSKTPAPSRQTGANSAKGNRLRSASPSNHSSVRQSRGSYRRQLTALRPGTSEVGVEAKRLAAVILEVLAGVRTPTGAATALGIRLPRYYLWEERAVQGLVAACEPRPRGRTVSPDRQLASLERDLAVARRELARHQALARTAQRALGLPAPAEAHPSGAAGGKGKGKSRDAPSGARPRRRQPTVRALRAARLLRAADSSGVNLPVAVQSGHGPPGAGMQTAAETPGAASAGERKHSADLRAETT